jgi:putative DNA methylase
MGRPPEHRLFAKLVLNSSDEKTYLPIAPEDEFTYQRCSEELAKSNIALPSLELADGYNTRQVLNYGYRSWGEFFNNRQLLALSWLHQAILELPDEAVRAAMLTTFSGALEFNNMFASYKGEGTGAIRHMFSHHILKPERVPIEGNVWGTSKSSGSFSTLFRSRLIRAIEYRAAPFEIAIQRVNGRSQGKRVFGASKPFAGIVSIQWPPQKTDARGVYLSCGSSTATGLAAKSIDLVVTDPPFFDNVHYSELADFFFAWQRLEPSLMANNRVTTRHPEEVQDVSAEQFAGKLRAVFSECCRVLKDEGFVVFSYHHSRSEGWMALADAVIGSGMPLVNCHPIKAEMSIATPKSQAKEPIQLDVVLVCRKQSADTRTRTDSRAAFQRALGNATSKAIRLKCCGLTLSANDRRIIVISQFLVEICAGRSSTQVCDTLSSNLTDLDLTAMRLLEQDVTPSAKQLERVDGQLVFLENVRSKTISTPPPTKDLPDSKTPSS